jgi:hypothetical protein
MNFDVTSDWSPSFGSWDWSNPAFGLESML